MPQNPLPRQSLLLLATLTLLPTLAPAQDLCGTWEVLPGLSPADVSSLVDLAVVDPNDIWAVGSYRDNGVFEDTPFSAHWDGTAWSEVPVPCPAHPLDVDCDLGGVDAIASDDVWAVGSFTHPEEFDWEPFVVRWDGTAWQWVDAPTQPDGSGARFYDVAALAPDDVWAIGGWPGEQAGGQDEPLAAHWDGSSWETVFVPYNTDGENYEKTTIHRLAVIAPNEIWAIGNHSGQLFPGRPFIVRWDGTEWRVMDPRPGPDYTGVTDITAFADDDVWISAARYNPADLFDPFKVLLHWDGSTWTEMAEPGDPFPGSSNHDGVASDSLWASANGELSHWNGQSFEQIAEMPDPGLGLPLILDLEALAECEAWAVGQHTAGNMFLRLSPGGAPQSLVPDRFLVRDGLLLDGDLGSLASSDDDRLEVRADRRGSAYVSQVVFELHSPEVEPGRVDVRVELAADITGARARLALWRWDVSGWMSIGELDLADLDQVHEFLAVPQDGPLVRAEDGSIRLRLLAGATEADAPDGFVLATDQVSIDVRP